MGFRTHFTETDWIYVRRRERCIYTQVHLPQTNKNLGFGVIYTSAETTCPSFYEDLPFTSLLFFSAIKTQTMSATSLFFKWIGQPGKEPKLAAFQAFVMWKPSDLFQQSPLKGSWALEAENKRDILLGSIIICFWTFAYHYFLWPFCMISIEISHIERPVLIHYKPFHSLISTFLNKIHILLSMVKEERKT